MSTLHDLWYLGSGVIGTLLTILWEDVFVRQKQLTLKDIENPEVLSKLISRKVTRVDRKADAISIGAGGTGTCRFGVSAHLEDGSTVNLFMKTPTGSLFERVFLTLFRVYDNEFIFYDKIRPLLPDLQKDSKFKTLWCPQVYHAKMTGRGKFLLVLEDVGLRPEGCKFLSIMDPYSVEVAQNVLLKLSQLHCHFWRNPPAGVWSYSPVTGLAEGKTPPLIRTLAEHAMKQVKKRYGHLLTMHPEVLQAFDLMLAHYPALRRFWSSGPLTLCHGDAHVGNMFFSKATGEMGFVDMQCVAAEHCMRDVSYHLINSSPEDFLQKNEEALIAYYLEQLNRQLEERGSPDRLDLAQCLFLHRTHAMWAFMAWIICCGTSDLVLEEQAVLALKRVFSVCQRLRCLEALQEVFQGKAHPSGMAGGYTAVSTSEN